MQFCVPQIQQSEERPGKGIQSSGILLQKWLCDLTMFIDIIHAGMFCASYSMHHGDQIDGKDFAYFNQNDKSRWN